MRHATITLTMDAYGHLFQGQESETVKKLRPLLNRARANGWSNGECAKARDGRQGPVDAAESRYGPDGLETANPVRYNHFDVDRRSEPPCVARGRLSRRVSELASGLTRNQVPRKGLWVRIPCPPL